MTRIDRRKLTMKKFGWFVLIVALMLAAFFAGRSKPSEASARAKLASMESELRKTSARVRAETLAYNHNNYEVVESKDMYSDNTVVYRQVVLEEIHTPEDTSGSRVVLKISPDYENYPVWSKTSMNQHIKLVINGNTKFSFDRDALLVPKI